MISRVVERTYSNFQDCPSILLANIQISVDIEKNKKKIEEIIQIAHEKNVNIVLFPELALTSYVWETEKPEEVFYHLNSGETGNIKSWIDNIRDSLVTDNKGPEYVFLNNVRRKNGELYNSTMVLNGEIDYNDEALIYDKIFLPPIEQRYFRQGTDKRLTIDTRWGRFGFLTCYDLCFVELARQYAFTDDVDAIITLAAWRSHAIREYSLMNVRTDNYYGFLWDLMNSSKAAYNQTWSLGVNTVGPHDLSGVLFWGGSGIWAPSGLNLIRGSNMREEILIIHNLDIKEERVRSQVEFNYRIDFQNMYRKMKVTTKDIKDLTPDE